MNISPTQSAGSVEDRGTMWVDVVRVPQHPTRLHSVVAAYTYVGAGAYRGRPDFQTLYCDY